MNYLQCRTKVAGLLNNRKATDAMIAGWMQSALQRIQRELRAPLMEKIVSVTIADPFQGLIIPGDMLELIDILNQEGIRVVKDDVSSVVRASRGVPGICRVYYRAGGKWLLGPMPAAGDVLTLVYYAEMGELVNDTDSNILTEIADDALCFATLIFAATNFSDTRKADWEKEYQTIMGDLQGTADADELSGAAVVSPAIHWPDDDIAYGGYNGGGYWTYG